MWSIIKWLIWGDPEEKDDLNNNLDEIKRKSATKKIERVYLNYKNKEAKKKIVAANLKLAKTSFKDHAIIQSTLNSQRSKKKRNRRKRKRERERKFPQIQL